MFSGARTYQIARTRIDDVAPDDSLFKRNVSDGIQFIADNLVPGASYRFEIFSFGDESKNFEGSTPVTQQTGNLLFYKVFNTR